ncbi:TlpA disulfide reductase family protein [Cocleimonas sp. KMM 6892]|uniref:TlpA family protein disulfide reductase n=1 Tax=unclassified Cocleimonas TaxID=2639732 RepID=UPI002DC03320|nr:MULTISPECIES: TlpA disulfide reductase family protein [unclassified Cocleimonas]MEB8433749.1 TlpA disulfide reductase family protein [Cocleimonas sp. KMM 6892]MEC4716560.1 TlpA disulfide reductase family protein [Cocleimonas sp. KMM 6895]MEC4746285.1 TlpA disulfide reductase family protein [Cocleimonas sp. KMM 6896]
MQRQTYFGYLFGILISTILFCSHASAETVLLPSEQEINVEEYGSAKSQKHVLWLTSERGISGELQKTVLEISKQNDLHILMPDWHDSYFLSPSRSALEKIPEEDYRDLIKYYADKFDTLFIVASDRAASHTLKALHQLQTEKAINTPHTNTSKNTGTIAGLILIAPYLQKQTPDIGKRVEYLDIAKHSNLPLYVFQAERSPRYVPLPQLIKALEQGGSQVYTHVLKGITGGFHARNKEDLTPIDLKAKDAFPKQINNALSMLAFAEAAPLKPIKEYTVVKTQKRLNMLKKVTLTTPSLVLTDLSGKPHNLTDYHDKIIVVSFWASWCRPCIEEMPSLVKLKEKYKQDLEILAVNVREDTEVIQAFTQTMGINFPILKDSDSSVTEAWKVYVYPSNFIVDKTGKLSFAATGAMDWQEPEIESVINGLIKISDN